MRFLSHYTLDQPWLPCGKWHNVPGHFEIKVACRSILTQGLPLCRLSTCIYTLVMSMLKHWYIWWAYIVWRLYTMDGKRPSLPSRSLDSCMIIYIFLILLRKYRNADCSVIIILSSVFSRPSSIDLQFQSSKNETTRQTYQRRLLALRRFHYPNRSPVPFFISGESASVLNYLFLVCLIVIDVCGR